MKGSITVQKRKEEKLQDDGKLAYMIAWRDRRIAALEDLVQAQEQTGSIYAAYITYLLRECGKHTKDGITLTISKADIREICGAYCVEAKDDGEAFVITLNRRGEQNGARSSEMADA